jgi:hypothetical protein
MVAMRIYLTIMLLGLSAMLLGACGDEGVPLLISSDETSEADDYMPFTTQGFLLHWQAGDTIVFEDPGCGVLAGCDAGDDAAFQQGILDWQEVLNSLGMAVSFITSGGNDVKVLWDDGTGVSTGVLGFAAINTTQDPSRRMVITTRSNANGFSNNSASLIRTIAVHEFGHMLGIWSHSWDSADIMYPFATGLTTLSNRDKATMVYLYGFTPDLNLSSLPNNTLGAPVSAPAISLQDTYSADPAVAGIQASYAPGMVPINPDLP